MKEKTSSLWFLVVGALLLPSAASFQCRNPKNCECIPLPQDEFEFHCPPNNYLVNIKVQFDQYISMDCEANFTDYSSDILPNIVATNATRASFRFCPLPKNSFSQVLKTFNMTKTKVLDFQRYGFEDVRLTKDLFEGLDDLRNLAVQYSILTVEEDFLENIPNLEKLSLNQNQLKGIGYIFKYTPHLRMLDLSSNGISTLPTGVFGNLTNLQKLYIWNNKLMSLSKDIFAGLKDLQALELSVNKIAHLDDDTFSQLTDLRNISLRKNSLTHIGSDAFRNNIALENVRIGGNPNLNLSDYVFSGLLKLKSVNIDNSTMALIPENLFKGSFSLEEISLNYNRLVTMPRGLFKGLRKLRKLSMRNNNLEELPSDIFSSLGNLEELNLANNKFKLLTKELFKNLRKLRSLDISNNLITDVELTAFDYLNNLRNIDLSYNKWNMSASSILRREGYNALNSCTNLEVINLEHNEIDEFPDEILETKTSLKELNLAYNRVTEIRVASLYTVSNTKVTVDLSNNNVSFIDFESAEITARENKRNYDMGPYYPDGSTTVILKNNSLKCDCRNYDLIKYNHDMMDPSVRFFIDLKQDGLKCVDLEPLMVKDLKPSYLTCPLMEEMGCPAECACQWRPFDTSINVDCSHRRLSEVPKLNIRTGRVYRYNQTLVNLEGNWLLDGPWDGLDGYDNVTVLDLSKNNISRLTWVPPHIEELRLSGNKLKTMDHSILDVFRNTSSLLKLTLDDNPWECTCEEIHLRNYLNEFVNQVDRNDVKCHKSGDLLVNVNDICKSKKVILLATTVTIVGFLLACALTVVFYYKYQMEIKVWLYAKGLFLWFVTEDELDKDKTFDVFISYSHKDEEFVVETLLPVLEGGPNPFKVCVHYRHWMPGEFITNHVANSVADSRRTLVVLSDNFVKSVWGTMEFRTAHTQAITDGRARVIVVIYGDLNEDALDNDLKSYLKTNTYVKWGDPWFWNKLKYALPHSNKQHRFYEHNKKHANVMLKIDDKFELTAPSTPNNTTTPPVMTLNPSGLLKNHPLNLTSTVNMETPPAEGEDLLIKPTK